MLTGNNSSLCCVTGHSEPDRKECSIKKGIFLLSNQIQRIDGGRVSPGTRFLLPESDKVSQDVCELFRIAFSGRDGIVLS